MRIPSTHALLTKQTSVGLCNSNGFCLTFDDIRGYAFTWSSIPSAVKQHICLYMCVCHHIYLLLNPQGTCCLMPCCPSAEDV